MGNNNNKGNRIIKSNKKNENVDQKCASQPKFAALNRD